jgi:hypothetical protein
MSAAVQQQEYLERLRASQLADREARVRKKAQAKAFDTLLDPDRHSGGGGSGGEPAEHEEPGADGEQAEPDGFGKHYA